jgi:tetratricopeptide (TPR) repeat protein
VLAADLLWLASRIRAARDHPSDLPSPRSPETGKPPELEPSADSLPEPEPSAKPSPLSGELLATPGDFTRSIETKPGILDDEARPPTPRRAVTQAFKAFSVTVPSPHRPPVLNEEATAERAARDGLWLPVVEEGLDPLVDVDVVLDDGRFAMLHRAQAQSFIAALTDAGALRGRSPHLLNTDVEADERLSLRTRGSPRPPVPASTLTREKTHRRRLIVVITDGVGNAWHTRAAQRLLAGWGKSAAVVVVHLLPAWLWRRTGIEAARVTLHHAIPAGSNLGYGTAAAQALGVVDIPVLETSPQQIRPWAEFAMGRRPHWRGAAMRCSPEDVAPDVPDVEDELSAEQWVQRLRSDVTPTAFQLAVHLAAAPLSLSLIRLVQRELLPQSTGEHLAELIGSGLVRPTDSPDATLPAVDPIRYDFRPGVRQELLLAARRSDTARVLMTVADHLADEVHELGALRDVIVAPTRAGLPDLPQELTLLVEPALAGLAAMAGPYTKPARLLRSSLTGEEAGPASTGHGLGHGPSRPEDNVYQHVVKKDPGQDYFGMSVNMSTVQPAPERRQHEVTPVWNVPQRNQIFTGREELLTQLHEKLRSGTTAVLPEALHGLGGVGKTQIAIEYCYRHQEDYDLVWWIPAERLPSVRQAYVDLATHLNLDVSEPTVSVPAVREALRIGRPYRKWLLVFDNAEDVEEIQRFFPTNGPGKIIITSRSRDWFQHANQLEVDVFRREESRELLRKRGPALADNEADEIAERLGDLPLAIEQAAVLLAETGMPISEYLRLFDEKREELLRVEGSAVPVAVAWNISFERLRQTDPAALQLLQVCAHLAPEPIPWSLIASSRDLEGPAELVEALRDSFAVGRMIRAIGKYSLCKVNHKDNSLSLHRLVQRVVISQLTDQEARLTEHCGHLLLANADPRMPRDRAMWPRYQMLLSHVLASGLENCDDTWARDLCINLIDFLYMWGDNHGYRAMAQRAVDTWKEALSPDHDATLAAELRLGRALRLFAEFEAAYRLHQHARDTLSELFGPDHERTLEAESFLSADLRFLGRFKEALDIDRRAYETLQRRFGPDDPLTLEQAHMLCIDWRLNGEPAKAKELDADTLRRKEEVLGHGLLSTQSSRAALAVDEMECGNFKEALRLQEQHNSAMVDRYGKGHPGAMDSINLLSVMTRKAGRHTEALKLSEEAVALFTARYGEKYQSTVAALLNHAVNLRHIGDLSQSVEIGTKARISYQEIFGPEHPNVPTAAVNVAVSLRLQGRLQEAYKLDEEAHATLMRMLGPDHPRTLVCSVNLASDRFERGEYDAALEQDRDTLERLRRVLGANHPTTLACAHNLGLDLRAFGQEEEARPLLTETLERYGRVLGEEHPAYDSAARGERQNCDIFPIPL